MLSTAFVWIINHQPEFYQALARHLVMSGVSLAFALAIGLPLAILIWSPVRQSVRRLRV